MTTYQSTEMQTKLQANVADAAEKSSIHGGNDLALHLAELLAETGVSPADIGGTVTFAGRDPLFPSAVRLGSAFALSAMAAAIGAAAICWMRSGQSRDLSIDLRKAAHGISPEFTFEPTFNGWLYPNPIGNFHPSLSFPIKQRMDGGFIPRLSTRRSSLPGPASSTVEPIIAASLGPSPSGTPKSLRRLPMPKVIRCTSYAQRRNGTIMRKGSTWPASRSLPSAKSPRAHRNRLAQPRGRSAESVF